MSENTSSTERNDVGSFLISDCPDCGEAFVKYELGAKHDNCTGPKQDKDQNGD